MVQTKHCAWQVLVSIARWLVGRNVAWSRSGTDNAHAFYICLNGCALVQKIYGVGILSSIMHRAWLLLFRWKITGCMIWPGFDGGAAGRLLHAGFLDPLLPGFETTGPRYLADILELNSSAASSAV